MGIHQASTDWSRRALLSSGATLVGGAALASAHPALAKPRLRHRIKGTGASEADWERLGRALTKGRLLRPWDADFHLIALPNNLRYAETLPGGIARCANAHELAIALDWAQQTSEPLVTRGGGHSYAGYSVTSGVMIDTSLLNGGRYNAETGRVVFGAGARNRDLYRLLRQHERAVTHGRCPSVGAAGFLLGGGIGFNMRARGLACDQVTRSMMVLPNGDLRRLSADAPTSADKALFWASRGGGGGNFGVTTDFEMDTFDVKGQTVTVFDLAWKRTPETRGECSHSVETVGAALMSAFDRAPRELGSRISFGAVTPRQLDQGYDVPISALGQYYGPRGDLEKILAPVYDLCKPNGGKGIQELAYWPAQDFLHEDGYATYYQERSAFVNRPFGEEALAAGLKTLRQWPGACGYCDLRFFQTGGKINDVEWEETAFVHRDSHWLLVVGLYWSDGDDHDEALLKRNHAWQNRFYDQMRPLAGGGAYQNFTDPSLDDYRSAYYGDNLGRLQAIKTHVDPDNLFRFPQEI